MYNPKRRILNIVSREVSIKKADIENRIKSKKTAPNINWLLKKEYLESELVGSDNLTITEKGEEYKHKLNILFNGTIIILLGVPVAIVALLTIPKYFSRNPNDNKVNYENKATIIDTKDTIVFKKDSTFFIIDSYQFNELVDTIEKKSGYVINVSSNRIFEITYSGDLELVEGDYYSYPGGNLIIKYNGNTICNFDSLRIERTVTVGTLKNELKEELNRRVIRIVKRDNKLLVKEIISTLGNLGN